MVKPRFLKEVKEFDKTIEPFKKEVINKKYVLMKQLQKLQDNSKECCRKSMEQDNRLYSQNFLNGRKNRNLPKRILDD